MVEVCCSLTGVKSSPGDDGLLACSFSPAENIALSSLKDRLGASSFSAVLATELLVLTVLL